MSVTWGGGGECLSSCLVCDQSGHFVTVYMLELLVWADCVLPMKLTCLVAFTFSTSHKLDMITNVMVLCASI